MDIFPQQQDRVTEPTSPWLPPSVSTVLTEAERHQLLVLWNRTQQDYPQDQCIHHLFEDQVKRTPQATAVIFEQQRLTYQELNQRADQLATVLQAHGVGPEVLVGLCVERSLAMVVGLLGILKSGGAYVPLDPSYPRRRLQMTLDDAQVKVLITQEHLRAALPEHDAEVVHLDEDAIVTPPHDINHPFLLQPLSDTLNSGVSANHLAYVIYTSGSTGTPKGVQIEHRSVVNFLTTMQAALGLTTADKMAAVTTVAFDIAALEIYLPLVVGAQVLIVPRAIAQDGAQLQAQLQATQITIMQATPATWQMLLASGWSPTSTSMTLLCGGEALSSELADRLAGSGQTLWNLYGPTESTIWSTQYCVDDAALVSAFSRPVLPIGRPIANTQLYILNDHLQLVPVGTSGELYIGGVGLARGYLNQPELTAQKFIANPFGAGRLYRTGDLARYQHDGTVEFLGRLDQQVKIRGFRIELGEIESVLSQHEQVHQCVVLAQGKRAEQKHLTAYVCGDPALDGAALRHFLEEHLPAYMVPNRVVVLPSFPLTPNGKIDRQALPHWPETLHRITECGPRTATMERLAAIWSRALQRDGSSVEIGVDDNFFELGGTSIIAAQLCADIEKTWGKALPLATLLQTPTIIQLAHYLDSDASALRSSLVAMQPNGSNPPLFCIHGVGGNVMGFHDLARCLGSDQPVYGLQSRGLEGDALPLTTIADMARHYLAEIQAVYPHGPYLLAGYCMGSFIALEMAHLLKLQGEEIAFLALLDPDDAQLDEIPSPPHRGLREKLQSLRQRIQTDGVINIIQPRLIKLSFEIYQRCGWPQMPMLKLSSEFRLLKVLEVNMKASQAYRTTIDCPCKAILFLSAEMVANEVQHKRFWSQIAADLEVHHIPGCHRTGVAEGFLRDPQVKTLAAILKLAIDEVNATFRR
jgi:amino acid adenylation domain-containing protein